jgi:hypothetical protein
MKFKFAVLLIILLITAFSVAEEIRVPGDFSTVQAAIDASSDCDVIIIQPGIYDENIQINGQAITIRSTDPDDPAVVANTIIAGNNRNSVVTFSGTENEDTVLEGITIKNGRSNCGGGINGNETLATIRNCIIENNKAVKYGGGIYKFDGLIEKCIIRRNYCDDNPGGNYYSGYAYGAGISSSKATIRNCLIYRNHASASGQSHLITGPLGGFCAIGNAVSDGGGLYNCSGTIENCLIYSNSCSASISSHYGYCWGFAHEGSSGMSECTGIIRNCIIDEFSGLSTPEYSCINKDPGFVDPDNYDFHLRSDSPCIDAGGRADDVMEDFDCNQRPFVAIDWEQRGDGSHWDIGPYEYRESYMGIVWDSPANDGWSKGISINDGTYLSSPVDAFYIAEHITDNGSPGIKCESENPSYGVWFSPEENSISYTKGSLYRISYTIHSSQNDRNHVPHCRLFTELLCGKDKLVASGGSRIGRGISAPDQDGESYFTYFAPPDISSTEESFLRAKFEVFNFSSEEEGTNYLDEVLVERFSLSDIGEGTVVSRYDKNKGFENWEAMTLEAPFGFAETGSDEKGLFITTPGPVDSPAWNFGMWSLPPASSQDSYLPSKMYRAVYTLSRKPEENTTPGRVRMFNMNHAGDWNAVQVLITDATTEHMPTVEGREYSVFFESPPRLYEGDEVWKNSFGSAFDVADGKDSQEGTVYLNSVEIQIYDIP